MRLFIAEKPSMGREISKYLPEQRRVQKRDGFIVQGDDVVTWAFGHVLEQAEPGDYNERYKRWNAADLPIVPDEWRLLITKSSEKQFHIIKRLIEEADEIVNAGDPDREGQLLIDEILLFVNNKKPVKRILLNALDEKSIRFALADLRDNKEFYNLQQSALARARADWLIGMNLSRAYTLQQRRQGHKVTFPIGRVKTPTLALVVRRERELENFIPVDYFTLKVLYEHANGSFWATWQPGDEQAGLDSEGRLLHKNIAEELAKRLTDSKTAIIAKREKSKKKEPQKLPLSLSALQVAAGKAYGYDPQQVLDTAQKLYEKKLTTYPRSDCDYLPHNQYGDRTIILANLSKDNGSIGEWAKGADQSIISRAWNDKKITAHHAIIPTTVACNLATLSDRERHIYFLIAQAYVAQFYPEHEYEQTRLTIEHEGEQLVAHGRVITVLGWKALFQKPKKAGATADRDDSQVDEEDNEERDETSKNGKKGLVIDESSHLPNVKKRDTVVMDNYAIDPKQTKPPSRFTAATLLQAMKEIHKYVKNDDLKKQLKAVSGIGTEATRATIIDELITRRFMTVKGKKKVIQPTELGYLLVDALPEEMLYPDETALWEERLAAMSEGADSLDSFLSDQIVFLKRLIDKANNGLTMDGLDTDGFNIASTVRTVKRQVPLNNDGISNKKSNNGLAADRLDTSGLQLVSCPACGQGKLQLKKGKFGEFYGCTAFPKCRYTQPIGGSKRSSQRVEGIGLSTDVSSIDAQLKIALEEGQTKGNLQYKCPRCGSGYLLPITRNGRVEWLCSNQPQCRTVVADVAGKPIKFST